MGTGEITPSCTTSNYKRETKPSTSGLRWAQTQLQGAFKACYQINPQNKQNHSVRARTERPGPHPALDLIQSQCLWEDTLRERTQAEMMHQFSPARRGQSSDNAGNFGVVSEPLEGLLGRPEAQHSECCSQHRSYSAADCRLSLSSLFSVPLSSSSISPSSPLNLS